MNAVEKLRWAEQLVREKTGGQQYLKLGWDGLPTMWTADSCMVGIYFAMLKRQATDQYVCNVKGYIRTCGGYRLSAGMHDLIEECTQVAEVVLLLEDADIRASEEELKVFCEELRRREEQLNE